jgi:dTDP-4-dehydrorhamnose 3,5-epimerase
MKIQETSIPGLLHIADIPIFADERGSFRTPFRSDWGESFAQFANKQWNISENAYGTTRGIHAEPWDKFIHVVSGRVFAAFVDLRTSLPSFCRVETFELNTSNALFVPKGCGNSFQALEQSIYSYLTGDLWSAEETYPAVSLDDPLLAIDWPIKDPERIVSEKDRALKNVMETLGALKL